MSGYIGSQPVPQATQTRQTFTATSGQTSFATIGYVAGGQFIQVYLNGVLLKLTDDYTAANGSDIVLTSGAATGDILEFITFADFTVNNQNFTGGLTVDNDGSTVLTVDRATSDGTIIDLQKSGSSVGSIGSGSGRLTIGDGATGLRFVDASTDRISPWDLSTNTDRDNAIDLGESGGRFKDLYLSGGVVFDAVAGNATSNTLDDYEEGTWTPVVYNTNTSGHVLTLNNVIGKYKKIGNWVNCTLQVGRNDATSLSGIIVFANLPFTVAAQGSVTGGTFWLDKTSSDRIGVVYVVPSADRFYLLSDHAADNYLLMSEWQNSRPIYLQVSYNSA